MKIKNVQVYGFEESIIRSGYPMQIGEPETISTCPEIDYDRGPKLERAKKLAKSPIGSGHNNFLKGIIVQFDLCYPQYFTPQLQRYNWVDIISSQSKMHKLTSVKNIEINCNGYVLWSIIDKLNELIEYYNLDSYPVILEDRLHQDNSEIQVVATDKDKMFQYIISNLPMGYEMWMGISTNYLQLKTIYHQRKNHKLKDDWGYFCKWIEELPLAKELITCEK